MEEEEGQPPTSPMARLVTMMTNANPTTAAVEDAGSVAGQETVLRDKLAGICAFLLFVVMMIRSFYVKNLTTQKEDLRCSWSGTFRQAMHK